MRTSTKPKGLLMKEAARTGDRVVPITGAEREARVRLAACYRVFDYLGWTESIFNHITLRVPGPETIFLINPFGLHYSEVTASNLVAVDIDGHPVRPAEHPINLAGFVTHSAIHGNIRAAHCVMHTHTTTGSAVACLEEGLSHDTFYGAQLHGRVAYHEFEGVTVEPDERERMVASIGEKRVVILRNHGLLTWGETLEEAFMWLWLLQRACDIQVAAASVGRLRKLPESVLANTRLEGAGDQSKVCRAAFDALVRKVDAIDHSYVN
ncbi:MAG TPA: class II aldolase/adducin family protein [Steroidobacteraceae bacterium]|nr:class II aldolase/adducin family protein [Steroidobacteraceae bacterium]